MLQRDELTGIPSVLRNKAFILDVVCDQKAPSPDVIGMKLADALAWVEGCGEVNVGYLGEMEPELENE